MSFSIGIHCQCTSSGPKNAATFTNSTFTGSFSWSNLSSAQTNDNAYATASMLVGALSTVNSNYLIASNLGLSIPPEASICGITVEIEASATGLGVGSSIKDNSVKIIKGASVTGTEHANSSNWPSSDAYGSYGSNADLWGATWTPADINAAGFGVAISARLSTGLASITLTPMIDHIRTTVYFSMPLPVKLKSFTAKQMEDKVRLEWVTASESNNKLFIVERSLNNSTWIPIDSLKGAGDSQYDRYYYSFDNAPEQVNHYRLKQIDFDENTETSKIVVVRTSINPRSKLKVFFNPASSMLSVNSYKEIKTVQFFDANSTKIFLRLISRQGMNKTYNVQYQKTGIYFVRVVTDDGIETKKVLILR